MVDGCISLAKFDLIVAKKSLKTSAISTAEEIGSLFTLISVIFRTLRYLREVRSSISFHVYMLNFMLKPGGKLECQDNALLLKFKGNPSIDTCQKSRWKFVCE